MNNVIIVHVSFSFTSVILNSSVKLYVFSSSFTLTVTLTVCHAL